MARRSALSYGVIGLGRFGMALAKTLAESGCELLAIDGDEEKIKEIRACTENAFVSSNLSKEVLEEAGIQNCDVVIVGIGEQIDVSILTTLTVVSLGVPRVIAKATSPQQGQVLEKIGAEVIYPEHDMAVRLAKKLTSQSFLEYLSLNNEIEISELYLTDKLIGKTVAQANLRERFGVNIIAIEHGDETLTSITPDYVFAPRDVVVIIGKDSAVVAFEKFLQG